MAIFNDNSDNQILTGADNPWVQIDFGEGKQATIGEQPGESADAVLVHDDDVGVSGKRAWLRSVPGGQRK